MGMGGFVAAVAAMAAGNAPGQPQTAPRALAAEARAPAAVVDAFHRALETGDLAAAKRVMAADALIFESGVVERGVAEYAAHHLPADAAFAAATERAVLRRSGVARGDVAWITTEGAVTGSYKGKPINSRSLETMALRREGGTWRIVHIHWSSANAR